MKARLILFGLLLSVLGYGQMIGITGSSGGSVDAPPTFSSAEIGTYNDSILVMLMSEALDGDSIPPTTAFDLTGSVTSIGINTISIDTDTLFIALDSSLTVYPDSTFLVDYTPDWPKLQNVAENTVAAWEDRTVINNLGGSYIAQYQAVRDAQTTPATGDTAIWQNELVTSLVNDGVWSLLDLLYIFAQHTNANGEIFINWIGPGTFTLTENGGGSLTFSIGEGLKGDGINWLETGYSILNSSTNLVFGSMSLGVYQRDNETIFQYSIGTGSGTERVYIGSISGTVYGELSSTTSWLTGTGTTDGFHILTRTGDNSEYFRNSVSIDSYTSTPGLLSNTTLNIFSDSDSGSGVTQISIAFIGAYLNPTQRIALEDAVEVYMNHFGTGVN